MTFRSSSKAFYDQLVKYSDSYYDGNPLISDAEFDQLVQEYQATYEEEFTYIGSSSHSRTSLPQFMSSLNKCKDLGSIERFVKASPKTTKYVYSEKLDGISLLIQYNGDNVKLYTRGNGEVGSDVSHLLKYLTLPTKDSLNSKLWVNNTALVRGELIINKSYSVALGENLRNIVCGAVNAKTPDASLLRQVDFIAYSCPDVPMNASEGFGLLRSSGFAIPQVVVSQHCSFEECNKILTEFLKATKYYIDGIVVAKDLFVPIKDVSNPKHVMAFKRNGVFKETKVVQVHWQESRYGTLHPRVEIDPVVIDGCTINFVSGVNAKYIVDNQIGPNSVVNVHRSGDVIPNIVNVVKASQAQLPASDVLEWDGVHIKIQRATVSDSQQVARLTYSLKVLEAKGVSEQTVIKLYNHGLTNEQLLWSATEEQLVAIEGIKQRSAQKIIDALKVARSNLTVLKLLMISACFSNFGESKLAAICSVVDVPLYLRKSHLSDEAITSLLNGISIKTLALNFLNGCKLFRASLYWMSMLELCPAPVGVEQRTEAMATEATATEATKASTNQPVCTVVFSGFRDKDLVTRCASKGIKVVDNLTKNTSALVVTSLAALTTKVQKAKDLHIPIMDILEFQRQFKV